MYVYVFVFSHTILHLILKLQDFIPHALTQYKTYENAFFSKVTGILQPIFVKKLYW